MLHQISWFTYAVTVISLLFFYYLYVGIVYYRTDIRFLFSRLTGRMATLQPPQHHMSRPDYDIIGKAQPDQVEFVSQEELVFGADQRPEEPLNQDDMEAKAETQYSPVPASFTEMVSEVKTLTRVVNESNESKEDFEMLFRLIVQKYPELVGTNFQEQVNEILISEAGPQFPFEVSLEELKTYWTN